LEFAILLRFDYYNREKGLACVSVRDIVSDQAVQAAGKLHGRIRAHRGSSWDARRELPFRI
jgi:hypothetical protein